MTRAESSSTASPHRGFEPITPELKTWKPLPRRPLGPHYHGPTRDEPIFYEGKQLTDGQVWDPESKKAKAHIEGKYHKGVNEPEPHVHRQDAKYRFLASPVSHGHYRHTHEKMLARLLESGNRSFEYHLLKQHANKRVPVVDEEHAHPFSRKDKNAGVASRVDFHPLAFQRLASSERVYLAMEGCPKADSILSFIIRHSRPETVCSVPSVSLWEPPHGELDLVAEEFLIGRQVIVVPDADWFEKWQVERQALLLRQRLRRLGLDVHIAAPPTEWAEDEKKGVDDWLAEKHSLDDLVVIGREPSLYLPIWVAEQSNRRIDGVISEAEILEDMSIHADDGKLNVSETSIAGARGMETSQVSQIVKRLTRRGALRPTGKLKVVRDWFSGEERWQEVPEIEIADTRLCSWKPPDRRLADISLGEGLLIVTPEAIRRAAQGRITDAIVDSLEPIEVTLAEYLEMPADGRLAAIYASLPEPGTRDWLQMIAETINRVDAHLGGNVRSADLADGWSLTARRITQIRSAGKTSPNSHQCKTHDR